MEVLQQLLQSLTADEPVGEIRVGRHLVAVASRRLGLASNLLESDHPRQDVAGKGVNAFVGGSARRLAEWLHLEDWLKAGLGMAAFNSLADLKEEALRQINAKEIIAARAAGKNLAVIGHFPFVEKLRHQVGNLWVIEKRPAPGDLTEEQGYRMLGEADVVAMTGTCLINHTFKKIITCCRQKAYKIMLGPSTPMSPVLFDFGLDAVGGALVEDEPRVLALVAAGLSFRRLTGVRTVVLAKD